jgi:hypothetical protein
MTTRNYGDLAKLDPVIEKVKIVRAWDMHDYFISGIPPHLKQLVNLEALKVEHSHLCENVCKQLMSDLSKSYFETQHIGGGQSTEDRVTVMIAEVCNQNTSDLASQMEGKVGALTKAFDLSSAGRQRCY